MKSAFFKNARIFKLDSNWCENIEAQHIDDDLQSNAFIPIGASAQQSLGWVPFTHLDDRLAYPTADLNNVMLRLRVESKLLPASKINQATKERVDEMSDRQGYRVGRKQAREIKEMIIDELLPKAFSVYRETRVWFDLANEFLVIDSPSSGRSDEVLGLLAKSFTDFPVEQLHVAQSPAGAMTTWLADDEAPDGFTIDQSALFVHTGESRASVKYDRQSVEHNDVINHVQSGKQCERLALTFNDRISFTLSGDFVLRSIKPLDVLRESINTDDIKAEHDEFDSDLTLFTLETADLINAVVEALGGERL